jgi:hypothetical protein
MTAQVRFAYSGVTTAGVPADAGHPPLSIVGSARAVSVDARNKSGHDGFLWNTEVVT